MSSDDSIVATTTDFAPMVVGGTDRERSIASSAPRAHDGTSQRHRPEVHQTQFNVLNLHTLFAKLFLCFERRAASPRRTVVW